MSFATTRTPNQDTSAPSREEQVNSVQNEPKRIIESQSLSLYIQPKLTVGTPDDPYEREADAVADKVMRMPESRFIDHKTIGSQPYLQRVTEEEEEEPIRQKRNGSGFLQKKCTECEKDEEGIHRKSLKNSITPFLQTKSDGESTVSNDISQSIASSRGSGSTLDPTTHSFMSSRFGNDFSGVKIHTDSQAVQLNRKLNAKAFTVGKDVYFNQSQYQPNSSEGKQLLAHELTHVVQQTGAQSMLQKEDDVIEVEIVEAPTSNLTTVSGLVEDTSNNQEVILENFSTALENFETIVNASSAKEAVPKGVGAIVLDQITKVVIKEVLDKSLKEFPIVKQVIDLATSIITEVEKEKKRAGEAAEANALANFIVDERTMIRNLISAIKSNKVEVRQQAQAKYDKLPTEGDKEAYFDFILSQNHSIRKRAVSFSAQALFSKITELWISSSGTSSKPSRLFIRLDKNWKVVVAHIHAPRGQRLAERLIRNAPGGKIDLNNFNTIRSIEFFPADLTFVNHTIDANGKQIGNLTANIFGQKYVQTYIDNLKKHGLPSTSVMTGE